MGAYEFDATPGYSLVVNTPLDEDNGTPSPAFGAGTSLREAINFANKHPGAAVTFDPNVFAQQTDNLVLLRQPFCIYAIMSISGPPLGVAIDGSRHSSVMTVTGGILPSPVTLAGLTIQNGNASGTYPNGYGGGLASSGVVTLINCSLIGNGAVTSGGGFYNTGTASLTGCTLSGNGTSSSGTGGGIFNSGSLVLDDEFHSLRKQRHLRRRHL